MADKMTKKDYFEMLKGFVPADAEHADEVLTFIDKQIEQLDTKARKAKEKAAERKAEGDELRAMVFGALTDEFQTIDQIMAAMELDDPDITRAKITARLGQLVKTQEAVKVAMTVDKKRTMHYKLADPE